jgi:transposase
LTTIDKTVPANLDVHVICDNYGTHKTPAVRAWLARHPGFHLHFTPTGSSWINQFERWFALLTEQKIRRGAHRSVQALEADIRAWIADWNSNPRPFAWTKTPKRSSNHSPDFADEFPAQDTSLAASRRCSSAWRNW